MAVGVTATLEALRDIPGVHGSFVVMNGRVFARDLPKVFADEVLAATTPRLCRVWESFGELGSSPDAEPQHLVLNFSEHKLYVRAVNEALLCVVAGAQANMPALRMAGNLVTRRLDPMLASEPAPETLPAAPVAIRAAQAAPEAPSPEPPGGKRQMVFRGRKYEL